MPSVKLPAPHSPMNKLDGILANVEPGSRVGVVTMLGSLCPITLGHVQAFVEARRLLLNSRVVTSDDVGVVVGDTLELLPSCEEVEAGADL